MNLKSRQVAYTTSAKLKAAGQAMLLATRGDPTARQEAAMRAACTLLVTKGWRACSSPREVNRLMPPGLEWFRTRDELRAVTGGARAAIQRLPLAGAIHSDCMGKWTPDFWAGLAASGAFLVRPKVSKQLVKRAGARPCLLPALQGEVPFVRSWATCNDGTIFWGLWAARLGASDPHGIGVLAGLLAGGRRVDRRSGESWLGFAWREGNAAALERHMIPHLKMGKVGHGSLLVSPFWGVLLANEMPDAFGQWFRGWVGKKAMCPLLPWAFLSYAWGEWPGEKGRDYARRMVPWTVSSVRMRKVGLPVEKRGLRRMAFEQLGMRGVSPEVRAAWLRGLVAQGITGKDFPIGKIPLDFDAVLCNDTGRK